MGPQYILVFAVCFLASLLGPLCGIGGGVIIKPVVDAMNVMSVSTVSFLSSMSVLIMSLSTLAQNTASGQSDIDARAMSPIAVSSAVGGVIGKMLFNRLGSVFPDAELVGAVQAAVLIVLAVLVLAYTLNKARIKGLKLENAWAQALIGFCAGACWFPSSASAAAPSTWPSSSSSSPWRASPPRRRRCSSSRSRRRRASSTRWPRAACPRSSPWFVLGMAAMAVLGSVVGRRLLRRMDSAAVDKLYVFALVLIIVICTYNFIRFSVL
ncbi:MAG: TSUP family transporter [Collinsella sp.]